MEGVIELAESIFQTSVRLGVPEKFSGMENVLRNPIYATSIGLLAYGNDRIKNGLVSNSGDSFVSKAWSWLKNNYWLETNFIYNSLTLI